MHGVYNMLKMFLFEGHRSYEHMHSILGWSIKGRFGALSLQSRPGEGSSFHVSSAGSYATYISNSIGTLPRDKVRPHEPSNVCQGEP